MKSEAIESFCLRESRRRRLRALVIGVAVIASVCLAGYWEFEQVDSGSLGSYVAIDRMSDGTLWLAYVSRDSAIRLATKGSVWLFEDIDTALVRPMLPAEPYWDDPPFSLDVGPDDIIGVVSLGRLAERKDSAWTSEELPMNMAMSGLAYDSERRPSLTFRDSLGQGCLAVKTDSGWDTSVVFQPSGITWWLSLTPPAWRRNDNCALMEADEWVFGVDDGYSASLVTRDTGVWTSELVIAGLHGGARVFAALVDGSDSIHTFWTADDLWGTDDLVCDGVRLDSAAYTGAACLDTAGHVQCAWVRNNLLKFTVPGETTQVVGDAEDIAWCDITTDALYEPVVAFCRDDGSIWVAHGIGIVGQTEEKQPPTALGLPPTASIIRNVLFLQANGEGRMAKGELLDIGGRNVLDLRPGVNDVSRLAPGVYFVCPASGGKRVANPAKVIITR